MAPLLDFHDPSNSRRLPKERAHRTSIVPAIPRQLEKKYLRTHTKASNSSSNEDKQPDNVHPPPILKDSTDGDINTPVSYYGSFENDRLESPFNSHGKPLAADESYLEDTGQFSSSPQALKQDFTPQTSTSSTRSNTTSTQDFGISKYGDRLPPTFVPSDAHRDYLSSTSTSPKPHVGTKIDSAQVVGEDNNVSAEKSFSDLRTISAPEHVTAFQTANLPSTSSAEYVPLQTYPSYYGYVPGQPLSFFPEPESSSNDTPSPTTSAYQGYGHLPYESGLPLQGSYVGGNAGFHDDYQPSYGNGYFESAVYDRSRGFYSHTAPLQAVPGQLPFTPSLTPFNRITTFQPPVDSARSQVYHRHNPPTVSTTSKPVHIGKNSSVQRRLSSDTVDYTCKDDMHFSNMSRKVTEQPPAYSERYVPQGRVSLIAHLQSQFNNPTYADSRLQVYLPSNSEPIEYYVHMPLIVQSPLLKSLVDKSRLGAGNGILSLHLSDRFATQSSIEAALRFCYGKSASKLDTSSGNLDKEAASLDLSIDLMDTALAYIATGCLFELPDMALRGIELASENLNCGNIQSALVLAFDGGLGTEWVGDPQASREQEQYERTFMCSSTTDSEDGMSSINELKSEHGIASNACFGSIYKPYANQLLHRCLFFMSSWASGDWKLDKSAPPAPYMDRLPATAENSMSKTKAQLSLLRFGDFICANASKNYDSILSSILLCIPYQLLQHVFEVLIDKSSLPKQKAKILELVKERENRRQQVLRSKSVCLAEREEEYKDWEPVGWQELVEFSNAPNGLLCKLTRKWTGLKNPASSWRGVAATLDQKIHRMIE